MSEHRDHNELIVKWLEGKLSKEERAHFESDNTDLNELKFVLDDIDTWQLPEVNVEQRLDELRARRDLKEEKTIIRRFQPFYKIAAAIILIAVSYFVIQSVLSNRMISIETGLAENITHQLPDGSSVTLGPKSKIEYTKKNWSTSRELRLIGQGFFDVEKGSDFTVNSSLGTITVLGTEFDIFDEGNHIEVNCFEGSVRVTINSISKTLQALEGLSYDLQEITPRSLQTTSPDWLSGVSAFSDTKLQRVVNELERYFDLEIELPAKHQSTLFSGSFSHTDLSLALRSIFTPLEISYTLTEGRKVVFD